MARVGSAPLTVAADADVTVSGITLTGVNATVDAPIVTTHGILTLTRDTITGDVFATGIVADATTGGTRLALNGSTVADSLGGGLFVRGPANTTVVSLVNSTVSGNSVLSGGRGGGITACDIGAYDTGSAKPA